MKYEGDAVQFTAFALVAIESVWPNPDGDELSADDADLSLIEADPISYKSDTRPSFGTTKELSEGVSTARDYQSKQGYYKILPLNVTAVRTSSGLDGSNFSITFTLDDLLLVTSEESALRYATGLPFSTNDLVESDLAGALPQLLNVEEEGVEWRYIRDEELGLSRYRLTGPNSSFNIEDLVDVNDTVTIWIYHDPQDFYYKDELPEDSFFDDDGSLMRFNDRITGVIGSGDRRDALSTDQSDVTETLLHELGIINEFMASTLERLLIAEADEDEIDSQIPSIDGENLIDMLHNYTMGAISGAMYTTADRFIDYKVMQDFSSESVSDRSRNAITELVKLYNAPTETVFRIPESVIPAQNVPTESQATLEENFRRRRVAFRSIVDALIPARDSKLLYIEDWSEYVAAGKAEEMIRLFSEAGLSTREIVIESFIHGLNMFALELNKKTEDYVHKYMTRHQITRVKQGFINGRTTLLTQSHGETPYLALKGMVSKIETSLGTSDGSNIITITGQGYEKVLKTNEVFYEDFLFNSGINSARADYQTIYAYMQPPRAIHHLISRWASKNIVLGRPNDWSLGTFNRYMFLMDALARPEDAENEADANRTHEDNAKDNPLGEKIPLRGYFVQSEQNEYREGLSIDKLRLFSPLNYLNTTRIQEMTRTLNNVYNDPDIESISNTAIQVDPKTSIYDNARKLGGLDNFYQFFVDETGKVRYRLSFEAMERTPNPGYTPTIQDYDLLSSGNSFVTDDSQLVTLVNVYPLVGHHTLQVADLSFIGRSTPSAGKVPIATPKDVPEETLSPEFFRYGMKTTTVNDVYSALPATAAHKAHLYRGFFGQPLKKAVVRVRNNTSYRVGETVLLTLQKNKRRSRSLIELDKMRDWLNYLLGDEDLLKMYIGVDERVLERGKNTILLTSGEYNIFRDGGVGNNKFIEFNENPHKFVATMFLRTIEFMISALSDVNVITPEYFPTTYWYFHDSPGGAAGWDEQRVSDESIIAAFFHALRGSVLGDSSNISQLQNLLSKDNIINKHDVAGLINNLRFQNFRATSYFIESVSHNFSYGSDATTTLGLNYGQDNLVLLDPINLLPFGFMSIERKMRIGYDSPRDKALWNTPDSEMSSLQKMYIEQFKEDDVYKRGSFMYASQFLRNSSNYMYEIATVREGLDAQIDSTVNYTQETEKTKTSTNTVDALTNPIGPAMSPSTERYAKALKAWMWLEENDPDVLVGHDPDVMINRYLGYLDSIGVDQINISTLATYLRSEK